MTTETEDSFSSGSALLFAVISFVLYWIFLRPTAAPGTGRPATPAAATTSATPRTGLPGNRRGPLEVPLPPSTATSAAAAMKLSEAAAEVLMSCQAKPNHVTSSVATTGLGGSNILLSDSGLVAFSHTQAASVVSSDAAATVRQERAKILSRLCAGKSVCTPPSKGSTLVLSISDADLNRDGDDSLRRIIYALGTFYNLVVIVAVEQAVASNDLKSAVITKLRQSSTGTLTEQVLPSHRILLASTVTGRVALVRQLSKVAMTVDWDPEVESQLARFGYNVSLVTEWNTLLV